MNTDTILNFIADKWGGLDSPRGIADNGSLWFRDEDGSPYKAFLPGQRFPVIEDSGRPSGSIKVKAGKVYVRAIYDAPDCWFSVDLDEIPEPAPVAEDAPFDDDDGQEWEGPSCSICDALGHGYPGGGPCPLEDRGYDDDRYESATATGWQGRAARYG